MVSPVLCRDDRMCTWLSVCKCDCVCVRVWAGVCVCGRDCVGGWYHVLCGFQGVGFDYRPLCQRTLCTSI